jgi:hypothetical protein
VSDLLRARRIWFSSLVPEGMAFVADLPDLDAPGRFVFKESDEMEWCPIFAAPRRRREIVFEREAVSTLIVNPVTMGFAPPQPKEESRT